MSTKTMTPEEKRIRIGELCGLTRESLGPDFDKMPDYLNDLNAMRSAEETLCGSIRIHQYRDYLQDTAECWWRATAAERAQAFLRIHE